MENKLLMQVRKMERLSNTFALFGQGTKMPFILCDKDTFNDQIWVFTTEEAALLFAQMRKDKNQDLMITVKLDNQQLLGFYSSLYLIGINEVVFVEQEQTSKIPLESIVVSPDKSHISEEKQPLINPQLHLIGLYFMQEVHRALPNDEKVMLGELEEELAINLVRSSVLVVVEREGEVASCDNQDMKFPCLKNQDKKVFQPVFTDSKEVAKFNTGNKFHSHEIEFANVQKILGEDVEGVVLNPQGMNLIILKSEISELFGRFVKG